MLTHSSTFYISCTFLFKVDDPVDKPLVLDWRDHAWLGFPTSSELWNEMLKCYFLLRTRFKWKSFATSSQ